MTLHSQIVNHKKSKYMKGVDGEEFYQRATEEMGLPVEVWYDFIEENLDYYYWTEIKGIDPQLVPESDIITEFKRAAYYNEGIQIIDGYCAPPALVDHSE